MPKKHNHKTSNGTDIKAFQTDSHHHSIVISSAHEVLFTYELLERILDFTVDTCLSTNEHDERGMKSDSKSSAS
jgi:hypothetical protein